MYDILKIGQDEFLEALQLGGLRRRFAVSQKYQGQARIDVGAILTNFH